jgi:hypothetical protein
VELTQPRTVLRADRSTPIRGNQSLGAYGVISCRGPTADMCTAPPEAHGVSLAANMR